MPVKARKNWRRIAENYKSKTKTLEAENEALKKIIIKVHPVIAIDHCGFTPMEIRELMRWNNPKP